MQNNVWLFLPLLLYGIAVLLGLCLCYFAAPPSEHKHWIHFKTKSSERQAIRLGKTKVYQIPLAQTMTSLSKHAFGRVSQLAR
jgi:hypothetical protein